MNDIRELEFKFSNEIKNHLKKSLPNLSNDFIDYKPSSEYEDNQLSFDLTFNVTFTVSIRIRKSKYLKFKDLTIRSRSKGGNLCELDKIKKGFAQVYFYAYMNEDETELIKIRIVNVESIRNLILENKYTTKTNQDSTEFYAFKFSDIKEAGGAIYQYDKK